MQNQTIETRSNVLFMLLLIIINIEREGGRDPHLGIGEEGIEELPKSLTHDSVVLDQIGNNRFVMRKAENDEFCEPTNLIGRNREGISVGDSFPNHHFDVQQQIHKSIINNTNQINNVIFSPFPPYFI